MNTAEVSKSFVLAKCDYFADVQIWPLRQKLDPHRWLSNFSKQELEHAVHLLNAFIYYDEKLVDELFKAAFQGLSRVVVSGRADSFLTIQNEWREFFDKVIITAVEGEIPNVTDSGFTYVRKARRLLGIKEANCLSVDATLNALINSQRPVVFVDDFVGSGEQFIKTWTRSTKIQNSISLSFENLSRVNGNLFFYIPLICTEYGLNRIRHSCPDVIVLPAHIISDEYNVFSKNSLVWTENLRGTAKNFVKEASLRAGININNPNNWMGFHQLGLAIAFADSTPDATLPIFTWDKNNWKPLIKS